MFKRKLGPYEENTDSATNDCAKSVAKFKKPDIPVEFLKIAHHLNLQLDKIDFINKIEFVYNPTRYALLSYECYVKKFCNTRKKVMFLGMNPGPWGMSQTGVPFGEVNIVKNWLNIRQPVSKPEKELSIRPVLGFDCQRSEVSGKRFWGLMKELCGEPENFFTNCFVYNYLPLQFINSKGKNLPPTSLKPKEQDLLFEVCDEALLDVIKLYKVEIIVAIGKFAESRANSALNETSTFKKVKICSILHPSPQSKAANNWHADVLKQLEQLDLLQYLNFKK